jgi:hypothetical protein
MKPRNTAPREKLVPNPKARLQEQIREVMGRERQSNLKFET